MAPGLGPRHCRTACSGRQQQRERAALRHGPGNSVGSQQRQRAYGVQRVMRPPRPQPGQQAGSRPRADECSRWVGRGVKGRIRRRRSAWKARERYAARLRHVCVAQFAAAAVGSAITTMAAITAVAAAGVRGYYAQRLLQTQTRLHQPAGSSCCWRRIHWRAPSGRSSITSACHCCANRATRASEPPSVWRRPTIQQATATAHGNIGTSNNTHTTPGCCNCDAGVTAHSIKATAAKPKPRAAANAAASFSHNPLRQSASAAPPSAASKSTHADA